MPKISELPDFGTPEAGAIVPVSKANITSTVKLSAYQIGDLASNWGLSGAWQNVWTQVYQQSAGWGGGSTKFQQDGQNIAPIPTGSVGIGLSAADVAKKLHVITGDAGDGIRLGYNTTQYTDFWTESDGSLGVDSVGADAAIDLRTGSQSRMYIKADGNVGIGTTLPANLLHVNESGSGAAYIQITNDDTNTLGSDGMLIGVDSSEHGVISIQEPLKKLYIGSLTSPTITVMRHDDSTGPGYVGIGTASPEANLTVAGSISAQGNITVRGNIIDSSGSGGTAGQVLKTTGTAVDWVSLSEITGVDGTGSAGHIPYWNDADTITYDDGKLFWNPVYNVLGIGTDSPSQDTMLHLKDTSRDVILGIDAESGSGDSVLSLRNDARIWNVGMDHSDDDKLVIAVGGDWNNIRPEADRHIMTMTYSGNVGIGTIAPNAYTGYTNLEIDHATYGGLIEISKGGSVIGSLWCLDSNTFGIQAVGSSSALRLRTNSVDRLTVVSSGSVGVGLTVPTAKLHIKDGGTTENTILRISSDDASPWALMMNNDSYNSDHLRGLGMYQDGNGWGHIISDYASSNGVTFLQSTGGKVGIGEGVDPAGMLAVMNRNADVEQHFLASETTSSITSNSKIKASSPTGTGGQLDFYTKGDGASYSTTADLTILESGRVGIGVSPTTAKLEVAGSGVFAHGDQNPSGLSTSGSRNGLQIGGGIETGTTAGQFMLYGTHDVSTTGPYDGGLVFLGQYYNSGTSLYEWKERARISSAGNFGIGTTAPGSKMVIRESLGANVFLDIDAGVDDFAAGISLQSVGNTKWEILNDANDSDKFQIRGVGSAKRFTVDTNGKVGIGTTAPASNLTVASNGADNTPAELGLWATDVSIVDNDTIARIAAQGSDSGGNVPYQGAKIEFNADAVWDTGTNYYWPTRIDFFTQDNSGTDTTTSPRLTIGSNGSVGIGVSEPTRQLHIQDTTGDVILGIDAESGSGDSLIALRNNTRIWNVGMDHSDDDKFVIAVGGDWNNIRPEADRHIMTITHGGNVGIGTISPTEMLTVAGTVSLSGKETNGTDYFGVKFGDSTVQRTAAKPAGTQIFKASDSSWTIPVGVTAINIQLWGGGGTGTRDDDSYPSGGGGAGMVHAFNVPVTPGQSTAVVIGAGGTFSEPYGGPGGNSTVTLTVNGESHVFTAGGGGGYNSDSSLRGGAQHPKVGVAADGAWTVYLQAGGIGSITPSDHGLDNIICAGESVYANDPGYANGGSSPQGGTGASWLGEDGGFPGGGGAGMHASGAAQTGYWGGAGLVVITW